MSPQELYLSWVVEARRHILAILQDYPSLRPPIDHLCELLPRLQARYYSIASSSKVKGTSSAREGRGRGIPAEEGPLGGWSPAHTSPSSRSTPTPCTSVPWPWSTKRSLAE